MPLGVFYVYMNQSYICKISRKNSKWLLRKWQTTLGDTFLPHAVCTYVCTYCSQTSALILVHFSSLLYSIMHSFA